MKWKIAIMTPHNHHQSIRILIEKSNTLANCLFGGAIQLNSFLFFSILYFHFNYPILFNFSLGKVSACPSNIIVANSITLK